MSTKAEELSPLYVKTREPLSPTEAGRIGARKRWGEQRVIRFDQLDPDTARLVRALIANAEAPPSKKAAPVAHTEKAKEVPGHAATDTTAS